MSDLVKKIKSSGFFEVTISPRTFQQKRIKKVTELFPIIERCHVELFGHDFPYIARTNMVVPDRTESISERQDAGHRLERWRFFQSGQFTDIRALHSDWMDDYPGGKPKNINWKQGEVLFIEHVLIAFAETFEFAARLSNTAAGDPAMSIVLTVGGLQGRRLAVADMAKLDLVGGSPPAAVPEVKQQFAMSRAQLLADRNLAVVEASQHLFSMFGKDLSEDILSDWLRQLVHW